MALSFFERLCSAPFPPVSELGSFFLGTPYAICLQGLPWGDFRTLFTQLIPIWACNQCLPVRLPSAREMEIFKAVFLRASQSRVRTPSVDSGFRLVLKGRGLGDKKAVALEEFKDTDGHE